MIFACILLILAAIPAGMFVVNLPRYRRAPGGNFLGAGQVSVLIPARNEERNIADALNSILQCHGVEFEVLVLDDASSDKTAAVIAEFAARDSRVHLVRGRALPPGWAGKQHACWQLAQRSRYPTLCFLDSDVRLAPDALVRMCAALERSGAALISGIPRQITVTFAEELLIPLIHFILLGYLPMGQMQRGTNPSFSAGCGQIFVCRRQEYFLAGGHASICGSWHDGLELPRCFRRMALRTDLFDPTEVAWVRMYASAGEVWRGLGKNAVEGMAAPSRIGIFTILLLGGAVLPVPVLLGSLWSHSPRVTLFCALAALLSYVPRVLAASRFRQPRFSVVLHPFGTLLLLIIQWQALAWHLLGRRTEWKGRALPHPQGLHGNAL